MIYSFSAEDKVLVSISNMENEDLVFTMKLYGNVTGKVNFSTYL